MTIQNCLSWNISKDQDLLYLLQVWLTFDRWLQVYNCSVVFVKKKINCLLYTAIYCFSSFTSHSWFVIRRKQLHQLFNILLPFDNGFILPISEALKFLPILFHQSRDNWGQNSSQTDRQTDKFFDTINGDMQTFPFSYIFYLPTRFACRGIKQ